MKQLVFRLFFLFLIGFSLVWYTFPWASYGFENMPFSWKDYKLGLDLQGWIELDYKVDLTELKKEKEYNRQKEKDTIEGLKSIIDKRIQALNINDSEINDASYAGEQHIIVQIPLKWNSNFENKENIERAKKAIWKVVKIMFKEARGETTQADLDSRKKISEEMLVELKDSKYDFFVVAEKFKNNYELVEVWSVWNLAELNILDKTLLEKEWLVNKKIAWKNSLWESWNYILEIEKKDNKTNINYAFIADKPSEWKPATDKSWNILNEKYFVKSSVQFNQAYEPMVELTFNEDGKKIFWELSTRLVWKRMAIFVWGELLTAPNINEPILWGQAVITWNYTVEEAKKLSTDINTWVVPAPIYLTSEKSIDSRLWKNSLEKLIIAGFGWFILIFIFLIYTYRLSGFVSSVALIMYIIIILAIVKSFWIVLTMASIAGLVLSIGMAIDANILIFERVREEIDAWKGLEEATKVWFKKSWSAIWDSNITWFLVALILYIFWINLIKWFWLMLAIWIVVSLFSAMYISRVFVLLIAHISKNKNNFIWK